MFVQLVLVCVCGAGVCAGCGKTAIDECYATYEDRFNELVTARGEGRITDQVFGKRKCGAIQTQAYAVPELAGCTEAHIKAIQTYSTCAVPELNGCPEADIKFELDFLRGISGGANCDVTFTEPQSALDLSVGLPPMHGGATGRPPATGVTVTKRVTTTMTMQTGTTDQVGYGGGSEGPGSTEEAVVTGVGSLPTAACVPGMMVILGMAAMVAW